MLPWNEVYRRNYRSQAFRDRHWFSAATSLIESARLLEPRIKEVWESYRTNSVDESSTILADHFQGPYFMLVAYAVENLFKGRIVHEREQELRASFDSEGRLPKMLRTHNLYDLAIESGFTLADHDEDLLRRLTRCAIWAGRYPVPLRYNDTSGVEKFSDGKDYRVSWFGGDDIERLDGLINRIASQFRVELAEA